MPLPVAVGGRSVSAETLPQANCREEDSDDGIPLMPVELYQTIGWGICPQNEWLVRVTAGYYDLMDFNKGARDCTMCELRIQVSLVAKPLSDQYRETVHHLKLVDGARDDYPQFQPQVVVSQDRRNLAVLLFHPHQQSSAVVVFQLRRPRSDLTPKTNLPTLSTAIPIPAYCNKISSMPIAPAVATNPNFVSVWGISAMCSIPNVLPSVFLAVCNDGSLIWLDARSSATIAAGALAISSKNLPISSLCATAERLERGCLLAVSSSTGHCIVAQWKLESSTAVQQTRLERNSTGDLMVRSLSPENQEEQQRDSQDDMKSYHDFAEISEPAGNGTESNYEFGEARGVSVSKSSSTKHTDTRNSLNNNEENHQASRRHSSTKSDSQDGFQNAFKGLKSNRFWSSMAPKNLNIPTITGHAINSAANNANSIHDTYSSMNVQPVDWKSAYHQKNDTLEKSAGLQEQREREIFEREARRRKSHMNQFVLQELRKKTVTKSWVKRTIGRVSGRRMSLQRRRRRSDVGGQYEDPLRSTMHVDLLSVLEENVVAARFGTIPTVVCVVYKATRRHPEVAQMFSISEMGSFHPITSLRLSSEQVEEAASLQVTNAIVSDEDWDIKNSINTKFGLDLEVDSDTFAISTAFGDQWIGCLWNWRANALGLVIQNEANSSLWSRLYFGKEKHGGLQLCYLESCIHDLRIQTYKHLVTAGMLSPPRSHGIELEPCPLFLAADFVAFPYMSHETNSGTQQLEWKSSTLPLSYVNAYGAPKLAAVGRHNGSTIAIASSFGVCLLDSKYRWRQFGTPNEESSFSIVSMVWWEGNGSKKNEENEDFLLAIIQLRNGKQYLSCWSPKRLGTSHQLLVSASPDNSTETKWGIPLMKDVKASSLALLAEPASKSKGKQCLRKAVAFVTSTDAEASELQYASFQLQLSTRVYDSEKKNISILSRKIISGIVKDGTRSVGPISSILLAGASFRFDLQDRHMAASANSLVATLGIARSPGGFEVMSFDARNKAYTSTVTKSDEVSKISLVDIVHGGDRRVDTFVWAIELLNGELCCWFVPSLLGSAVEDADNFRDMVPMGRDGISKPTVLSAPIPICTRERRSKLMRYAMGILSHVGPSSDWMQQSASGCQSDIFLGPTPRSSYGCGLRAGQICRKSRRAILNGTPDNFAVNISVSESYGPSNFMITPPAFVPSLYSMLVEAAYRRERVVLLGESKISQRAEDDSEKILSIQRHVHNRLTTNQNKDAVSMTLRLFVLRTVEIITDVYKAHGKEPTDDSQSLLAVATTILSEVVECVRRCATDLQFASLFLEVGRQMEPSCLPHLFPLPLTERSRTVSPLSRTGAKSVADLFGICMQEGSLVASASALPLLGSRVQSRYSCLLLMTRVIEAFISNTTSTNFRFDCSEEERSAMNDIFRFGIKLEDAARLEPNIDEDEERNDSDEHIALTTKDKATDDADSLLSENESNSSASDFSDDSSFVTDPRKVLCSTERQNRVMNVFSMFDQERREELEIRKSALSFIGVAPGYEVEFPSIDDLENNKGEDSFNDLDSNIMCGLVGNALVELILSPKTDCPWKAIASIARILALSDCEDSVTSFTRVAESLKSTEVDSMIPDLHPDLRAGDAMDRLAEFLITETAHCGTEISETDADLIVSLVLHLLGSLEGVHDSNEQPLVLPGLVMVGLVAASVAGRDQQLLSTLRDDCFVSECCKVTSYDC